MQSSFMKKPIILLKEKFGADNVISAVMHADEINVAASEELGKRGLPLSSSRYGSACGGEKKF